MSLVSDWANWVDKSVIEKGKALLGETLEYLAPEDTKRRAALDWMGTQQRRVGAGISTGLLLTDKENPEFQDGFQLSDIASTYQKYGTKISPTQALFAASDIQPFNLPAKVIRTGYKLVGQEEKTPTGARADFNIYDDAQRRKAFDEEIIGKWATGAGDFAVSWFSDPFVVTSKVGLKIKAKTLTPKAPLGDVQAIDKTLSSKGASQFIDFALENDALTIRQHPVAATSTNPELVAGIFADINIETYGSKARPIAEDAFRAMLNDEQALGRLQTEAASLADIIDRAKSSGLTKHDLEYTAKLNGYDNVSEMLMNEPKLSAKQDAILDDLKKRNKALRSVLTRTTNATLESPFISERSIVPSPFAFVEKIRGEVAVSKAKAKINETTRLKTGNLNKIDGLEWTVTNFKQSIFDHGVRVISWSGLQRPSGWLEHKGIASTNSSDEIVAFLDTVKLWKNNKGAAIKRDLINKYISATTDADRIAVALNIENKVMQAINKKYKLDKKLTAEEKQAFRKEGFEPNTLSDVVIHKLNMRRSNVLEHYRTKGYDIQDGEFVITDPVLSSQIGDALPLIDIKLYERFAREELNAGLKASLSVVDFFERTMYAFDSVWRPAVLLRLGYPQRNVGEGLLRTALYQGNALDITMALIKGTKNSFNNFYHTAFGNRIDKYLIAKELGLNAPKATLGSWKSLIRWQKAELQVVKNRYQKLSQDLLKQKKIVQDKKTKAYEKARAEQTIEKIKEDLDDVSKTLDTQEKLYSELLLKISAATEKRGSKYNKLRLGQEEVTASGITFQGSAQGSLGQIGMKLASSLQRQRKEIRNPLMQSSQYRTYGWTMLNPEDLNYWGALSVNGRQLLEAEVTRRMFGINPLLGPRKVRAELNKIKEWFTSSDRVAREEFRNTNISINEIDQYIVDRWNTVTSYFPDATVRQQMFETGKTLSPYELEGRLANNESLVPIHGEVIAKAQGRTIREATRDLTDTLFKYLGSMPEDILVRHPFYDKVYKSALQRGADSLMAQSQRIGKAPSEASIRAVEKAAHREALKETNRVLFTIKRYSNLAGIVQFAQPFIQAQLNSFRVWGRLLFENPTVPLRPTQVWNDPFNKELVQNDPETGEPVVTMQIPQSWRKYNLFASVKELRFPITRFNIVFAGQPWYWAGFGPVIQIPASQFVKAFPEIDITTGVPIKEKFINPLVLPFGSSKEPVSYDLAFPAMAKRIVSIIRREDDNAFFSALQKLTAIENQKFREGLRTEEPTPGEMINRTVGFFALRLGINATFGIIPDYGLEYKPYFDIYNSYRDKYGQEQADALFYEKYPDYFEMVITTFRKNTTGSEGTPQAVYQSKKNEDLITKVIAEDPYITQLITNDIGAEAKFDNDAYIWQLNNKPGVSGGVTYRYNISPEQAQREASIKLGWTEYNSFMNWLNSKAEQDGFANIQAKGATYLKDIRKQFVEDQRENNPEWYKHYTEGFQKDKYKSTLRAIDLVLEDKKFTNSEWFKKEPAFQWLVDYMDLRDYISKQLNPEEYDPEARKAISSDIDSPSNSELATILSNFVADAKRNSPKFSIWYDRYLEQDKFGRL